MRTTLTIPTTEVEVGDTLVAGVYTLTDYKVTAIDSVWVDHTSGTGQVRMVVIHAEHPLRPILVRTFSYGANEKVQVKR